MFDLNSLLIIIIKKYTKLNFKSPKKVIMFRLFSIIRLLCFNIPNTSIFLKEKTHLNKKNKKIFLYLFIFEVFVLNFLLGPYPIEVIWGFYMTGLLDNLNDMIN